MMYCTDIDMSTHLFTVFHVINASSSHEIVEFSPGCKQTKIKNYHWLLEF